MGAHSPQGAGGDKELNQCGIPYSHAYTILAAFKVSGNGKSANLIMVRNPWGNVKYNQAYYSGDKFWNS